MRYVISKHYHLLRFWREVLKILGLKERNLLLERIKARRKLNSRSRR